MPSHTTSHPLRPWLLATPATLLACAALAQDATLDTLTVRDRHDAEHSASVAREAIEARSPASLGDALRDTPGVGVGGGAAIAQKIYLRGIEDSMLATSLDGASQSGRAFHHQSRLLVDPQLLERVDIDAGIAPASAGPGALAGAIRMRTRDGRSLLRPGQSLGLQANGGWASNDGHQAGATLYGLAGERVDFLLSANRQHMNDYADGHGHTQARSGSTGQSQLAKINWQVAPGHRLSLGYQNVQDRGTRYLRPNFWAGQPGNSLMPQDTRRETLTASYRMEDGAGQPALEVTLFSDELRVERTALEAQPQFNKPAGYRFGEEIRSEGVNLLAHARLGQSRWRYGLNHHRFDMQAIQARPPAQSGSSGRERSSVQGLFAEADLPLAADWLLGLGARYDWYDYTDNHGQSFDSQGLSPRASLAWQLSPALSMRVAAARTLRGAGLKEAFYVDNMRWRNDPQLRPEKALNYEWSLNYAQGPWSARASLFRQSLDGFVTTTTGSTWLIQNVGRMRSSGYELGVQWQKDRWSAGLALSQARPRINGYDLGDEAYGLGVATGRSWNLQLGHRLPAWNLDVQWVGRFTQSRTQHEYLISERRAVTKHKAGYGVHDLFLNWQPHGDDRLRVSLGIRNLFDQFYYDQASYATYVDASGVATGRGFAEPGRNVRLDLRWTF